MSKIGRLTFRHSPLVALNLSESEDKEQGFQVVQQVLLPEHTLEHHEGGDFTCVTHLLIAHVTIPSCVQRSWYPKDVFLSMNYAYRQYLLPSKGQTHLMLFAVQRQHYHALKIPSLPQCLQAVHNVGISSCSILTSSQQKRMQSCALTAQLKYAVAVILTGIYLFSPDQPINTGQNNQEQRRKVGIACCLALYAI